MPGNSKWTHTYLCLLFTIVLNSKTHTYNLRNHSVRTVNNLESSLQPRPTDDLKEADISSVSQAERPNSLIQDNLNSTPSLNNNNNNIIIKPCKVILNDIITSQLLVDLQKTCGNGADKHIFTCKMDRCKLKENFIARNKVVSTCSKRIYDCITPPGSIYINCHSANVIYLITCNKCGLQYVGETVQRLNERFTMHRQGIKSPEKHGTCRILSGHFNKGTCKGSGYTVQILEKLDGDGRTDRRALDPTKTALRKGRELHWMLKLRTVFPYGLNDRIGDEYKTDQFQHAIASRFPPLKRSHPRIKRGISRKGHNTVTHTVFLKKLNNLLQNNLHDSLNFIRFSLASMKKSELKLLADLVNDEMVYKPSDFKYFQWYSAVLDTIDARVYKSLPVKSKKPPPKNVCHIHFDNKGIEMINLSSILNSPDIKKSASSMTKSKVK